MMHNTVKLIPLVLLIIITLSACGQLDAESESSLSFSEQVSAKSNKSKIDSVVDESANLNPNGGVSNSAPSSDMVSFEGLVFVATTDLDEYLWQIAGWRISAQGLDTDSSDIPQDCTLYPHDGVSDQWVGSCSGYILVPRNGAKHIAVMVTDNNGSTNMVQVAP
jgi:hypothetical protein